MLWLMSAFGTALCFGINNSLFKWGATKDLSKVFIQFFFYLVAFLIVLLFTLIQGNLHVSFMAMVYGSLIGILNANGNIQMTRAFEKGPASITSTLIAMNTIVVVLATALFFPESIPMLHWLGVMLMIGAVIVIQYQPNKQIRIDYKPWLLRCLFAILSIGSVGFLLKVASYERVDFLQMLVSMYGGGLIFLGLFARKELMRLAKHKTEMKIASLVGILSTIGYSCYLFALKNGPASVVFPIISLNCIVVMIAGLLIFKERLKSYQLLGMAVALFGLVLTKV